MNQICSVIMRDFVVQCARCSLKISLLKRETNMELGHIFIPASPPTRHGDYFLFQEIIGATPVEGCSKVVLKLVEGHQDLDEEATFLAQRCCPPEEPTVFVWATTRTKHASIMDSSSIGERHSSSGNKLKPPLEWAYEICTNLVYFEYYLQ